MILTTKIRLVAIGAAFALGLTGCAGSGGNTGPSQSALSIAINTQPSMLDTAKTTDGPAGNIARNIFETLITIDSKFDPKPMLADSWAFEDGGKVLSFKMRQGVKFHDGSTMTAGDVVASMDRWSRVSSTGKSFLSGAKWAARDESTVTLTMPTSNPAVVLALSTAGGGFPAIMPKKILDKFGDEQITEYVGTGPYKFVEWRQDQDIALEKFGEYSARSEATDAMAGNRTGSYEKVTYHFVPDSQTRLVGVKSGTYDLADASPADFQTIKSDPNLHAVTSPGGAVIANYNKAEGPFTDLKLRQAANAAINAEPILQAALGDPELYDIRPGVMLKNQSDVWNTKAEATNYNVNDPDQAKKYLSESKYDGAPVRLIAVKEFDTSFKAAVVVQQQLEAIGFKTKLESYDWPTFQKKRLDPTAYDIMVQGLGISVEPSASVLYQKTWAGFPDDPALTAAIAEYRNQPTLEDSIAKWENVQEASVAYLGFTKIGDAHNLYVTKKELSDVTNIGGGFVVWTAKNP